MSPNKLLYENATVYAQPSFRVIAMIDMPLSASPMRQAMQTILDHFLEAAGERLTVFAYSGGKVKSLKPEVFSPKILAKARKLIAAEVWAWPSTLRFNGYFDEPHPCVAPPHMRFEQRAQMGVFQI